MNIVKIFNDPLLKDIPIKTIFKVIIAIERNEENV